MKKVALFLFSACCFQFSAFSQSLTTPVRHVVVIGVDGMSPDGIQKAPTPVMDRLMREGAFTMHARSVTPSSSSPNWASIIMGADVEQHGIHSNDYERDQFILPPVVQGNSDIFPSVFGEINDQMPKADIGAIYDWDGFGRLFEKNAVDYDVDAKGEQQATNLAVQYLSSQKPTFCFVHLDHVDHAGHESGHGSPEYYRSVTRADSLIGQILAAVENSGLAGETLVLICSDHGGIGKGHGGLSPAEMNVPLLLWGAGVRKGYELPIPVFQYDIAATALFALGLEAPYAWIGRPLRCAFEGFDVPKRNYPVLKLAEAPAFGHPAAGEKPAGGVFTQPVKVALSHAKPGQLRYTLDGTMPTPASPLYAEPFLLKNNTVVRCALFNGEQKTSVEGTAYYRFTQPGIEKPVRYTTYLGTELTRLPDVSKLPSASKGRCAEITSEEVKLPRDNNTVVVFETMLNIEKAGEYRFFTRSDDGSALSIDGAMVVDNDGDHGVLEAGGKKTLAAGKHPLRVEWFNGGGGKWLDVYIQGPGLPKQILPASMLSSQP